MAVTTVKIAKHKGPKNFKWIKEFESLGCE